MPQCNRHASVSSIYILYEEPPGIVTADADDHQNQHGKQIVYHGRVQLFVQLSAHHTAANAAKDHDNQPADMELRNAGCCNAGQQAGAKCKEVELKELTLSHVDEFSKMLADAGIETDVVSPKLLPDYRPEGVKRLN